MSVATHQAAAQGTGFTYQGRFNDAAGPFTGNAEFQFSLWDAASGGNPVAGTNGVSVFVTNGLFTVPLDFGASVFTGPERWLQIEARTTLDPFTVLSPRQRLTPAPYAIYAGKAMMLDGALPAGQLTGSYPNTLTLNNPANSFVGAFTGNGAGLSNVNALTVGGQDASVFARLNGSNIFTGSNFFGGAATFSGVTFTPGGVTFQGQPVDFSGTEPNFLAATTTPFRVFSTVKVTNLNADFLDGFDSTAFPLLNASNVFTGFNAFTGTVNAARFVGDGSGLTNLPAVTLMGTYSNALTLNNPANAYTGAFSGSGAGLSNLSAAQLSGVIPAASLSNAWQLAGNAGTTAGTHFLGTTDNQPVELKANGVRALRLEPNSSGAPNVVGGAPINFVAGGVVGATIAGGGASDYLGLGLRYTNSVAADFGTVGGGNRNAVAAQFATIGGGERNTIQAGANWATIAGGTVNTIESSAFYATIGGGQQNTVESDANYSTIGGGGFQNIIRRGAVRSTIGGGVQNSIGMDSDWGTIAGGADNTIGTNASGGSIGGGTSQSIGDNARYATIGGGTQNYINQSADHVTIGGGNRNSGGGDGTTVGGGVLNNVFGYFSTIGGGSTNTIEIVAHYSTIGGGHNNRIGDASENATIGGGADNMASAPNSTVGGGRFNEASGDYSTVGGGSYNSTLDFFSTVGGGSGNFADGFGATVSGGYQNGVVGPYPTVGGGAGNTASGQYATVPGGRGNIARDYAFAAGRRAKATHTGAFVWADSQDADFASTAANQFLIRASGGVGIGHNNPDAPLHVVGGSDVNLTSGGTLILGPVSGLNMATDSNEIQARNNSAASTLFLNAGGGNVSIGTVSSTAPLRVGTATCDGTSWNNTSDRNLKSGFTPVDARAVLAKVAALPLQSWHYTNAPGTRHVGPMAQDFHAAFGVGADDKLISTVDADSVALAAIQGLNQKLTEELKRRDADNAELKSRLATLERIIANLDAKGD